MNKLFTYGTLCSGFKNPTAIALHAKAKLLGPAQIKGTLYLINQSYPGLIQTELDSTWIKGEIWELSDPQQTIQQVDEYEGCASNSTQPFEYKRVVREVLHNRIKVEAWVYLYRLAVNRDQEIMSGDFKNHL